MTPEEILLNLDRNFRKRIRLVAQSESNSKYSSIWIFWGHANSFYFGAKSAAGAFKVSLHDDGFGYVAFVKEFFEEFLAKEAEIPSRTLHKWKLPVPPVDGAVQLAVVRLPADFCTHEVSADISKLKALVLGIEKGSALEIGLFASVGSSEQIEKKFVKIGHPLFAVTLENNLTISIVVRSAPFNPSVVPTSEGLSKAKKTELKKFDEVKNRHNLNMVAWNGPNDGEVLQVVDIGGVKIARLSPDEA